MLVGTTLEVEVRCKEERQALSAQARGRNQSAFPCRSQKMSVNLERGRRARIVKLLSM
jgi:hypothetical protein